MNKLFSAAWVRFVCILVTCGALLALLPPVTHPPFGAVFAVLAWGALLCCIFIRKTWVTYVTMIALPLFAVAAIMEFQLLVMRDPLPPVREEGSYPDAIIKHHPVHGFGPMRGEGQWDIRISRADTVLCDAVYTTNAQGWRITPQHPDARTAVFFFGCSFTWGYGVQDQQSYPYIVGELLGDQFQVYNFAFNGYGSHHFLAMLESGELDALFKKYSKVYVFYLNIANHETRPVGYAAWDTHGPRYVLKDGKAVRQGNFALWRNRSALGRQVHRLLSNSLIYRDIFIHPGEWIRKDMRTLDNAIIKQGQRVLQSTYPQSVFTLLVYPDAVHHIAQQKKEGLAPLDMTAFFPLPITDPRYTLADDTHPSVEAHTCMARGIAGLITEK